MGAADEGSGTRAAQATAGASTCNGTFTEKVIYTMTQRSLRDRVIDMEVDRTDEVDFLVATFPEKVIYALSKINAIQLSGVLQLSKDERVAAVVAGRASE